MLFRSNDTATTEIYTYHNTLSLHDALPICRRCQRDLDMSFAEWRQRLCVVKALPLLESGAKVESIALDLGYASASAFIAMFKRMTGVTPNEHRRLGGPDKTSKML